MIHPIRPVGWSTVSAATTLHALCSRLGRTDGCWKGFWLAKARLLIPLALRGQLAREPVAPAIRVLCNSLAAMSRGVEPWQPWSAHPPYADEVTRWWPSDDWPPTEPPVAIEDTLPDTAPPVIEWREYGGSLDFWA